MAVFYQAGPAGPVQAGLWQVFPFLGRRGAQAALVGGGGKTTLMYCLAGAAAARGGRVLATTSTHILCPQDGSYAAGAHAVQALWAAGRYAVVGQPAPGGKLCALPPPQLAQLSAAASLVLTEADGAKRRPCKAPRAHEPVLPPACDVVVAVAGASALGQPVAQACYCVPQVCALLGVGPQHILTPADLAVLFLSSQGGRKGVGGREYYVLLNQCDTPARLAQGYALLRLLAQAGLQRAALACLLPQAAQLDTECIANTEYCKKELNGLQNNNTKCKS